MACAAPPAAPRSGSTHCFSLEVIAGGTASLIETSCRYRAMLSGVDKAGVAACAHLAVFGERKVVTALERLAHYALDRLG